MIAAEMLIAPRRSDTPAAPTTARTVPAADFAQLLAQSVAVPGMESPVPAPIAALAEPDLPAPPTPQPTSADFLAQLTRQTPVGTVAKAAPPAEPAPLAVGLDLPAPPVPVAVPAPAGQQQIAPPAQQAETRVAAVTVPAEEASADIADPPPADPAAETLPADAVDAALPERVSLLSPDTPIDLPEAPDDRRPDAAPAPRPTDKPAAENDNLQEDPAPTASEEEPPASPPTPTPAQPITLPPLATMIQPLLADRAPQGEPSETDATAPEPAGTPARPRAVAGRLAAMPDQQPADQPDAEIATFRTPEAMPQKPAKSVDHGHVAHAAAPDVGEPTAAPLQTPPADFRPHPNLPPQTQARLPDPQPIDTTAQGWETALTERITTRATDLGQEIEITLTPDTLGTVRIKLDLSDKMAAVQIVTDTPQAAQLFQQSEARLSEAFSRAGLTLTSHDAASRDGGARDGGQGGQRHTPGSNPRNDAALAGLRGSLTALPQAHRGTNLINIVA